MFNFNKPKYGSNFDSITQSFSFAISQFIISAFHAIQLLILSIYYSCRMPCDIIYLSCSLVMNSWFIIFVAIVFFIALILGINENNNDESETEIETVYEEIDDSPGLIPDRIKDTDTDANCLKSIENFDKFGIETLIEYECLVAQLISGLIEEEIPEVLSVCPSHYTID